MHGKILCIVSIFFIFFKVQLCQKLAGFSDIIVHCSVLQNAIRSINLQCKVSAQVILPKHAQNKAKSGNPDFAV